jgi:hypothetical protein
MSGFAVSGVAIYSGISSMQSSRIAPRPLVNTLDDLTYTSLAKDYIQNFGQKVVKGAEYAAALASIDRPTNLGDSNMVLGEAYPGHITIPSGVYNLAGTLQGVGEIEIFQSEFGMTTGTGVVGAYPYNPFFVAYDFYNGEEGTLSA